MAAILKTIGKSVLLTIILKIWDQMVSLKYKVGVSQTSKKCFIIYLSEWVSELPFLALYK